MNRWKYPRRKPMESSLRIFRSKLVLHGLLWVQRRSSHMWRRNDSTMSSSKESSKHWKGSRNKETIIAILSRQEIALMRPRMPIKKRKGKMGEITAIIQAKLLRTWNSSSKILKKIMSMHSRKSLCRQLRKCTKLLEIKQLQPILLEMLKLVKQTNQQH